MRRFIRNGLVAAIALSAASYSGVVKTHGRLKIQNHRVVDSLGTPIQLAGMSLYWSTFGDKTASWGANDFFNANVVATMANDWKSSLIRAPAGVISGSGQNVYNYPQTMNLVKQVVDAAIANDIYVIVDWHLENSDPDQADATKFFTEMSQTYKSSPNIIWEIWNEPKNVAWSTIKTYANAMIPLIRQNSPNLIVVGTPTWSHNPDQAASDPITVDMNVAYSLHFYANQNSDAKIDADNNTAMSAATTALQKVPLFITEWGTVANSGSGTVNTSWSDKWLAWAKTNGVSWANWSLCNKNESEAALTTSASSGGGWSDNQLSPSGTYVKAKILEVAAALKVTAAVQAKAESVSWGSGLTARYDGKSLAIEVPAGTRSVSIRDLAGRILAHRGAAEGSVLVPLDARGLVLVQANGDHGSSAIGVVIAR